MGGHIKFREIKKPSGDQAVPFILEEPPQEVNATEGQPIEIVCKFDGTPKPTAAWKKGQWMAIKDGGRYKVTCTDDGVATMTIKQVRDSDLGKYKVTLTNECAELTCSFAMKVTKVEKKELNPFDTKLKKRKPKKKKVQKTEEELEEEVLEILKQTKPKDYENVCRQHGFYNFRMMLSKLKKLKKKEAAAKPQEKEVVKVMKQLRHVNVHDEGTAVFEIQLENSSSKKDITWFHNGKAIKIDPNDKRFELRHFGNMYQLIIRNAGVEDAGAYHCEIGGAKFETSLNVKQKDLKFEEGLQDKTAKVSGRTLFQCSTSRRGLFPHWFKDGQELDIKHNTGRIQAITEKKMHKLLITDIEMEDAGRYAVRFGDIEDAANLEVVLPSVKFRQRLHNLEVKEKGAATFECSVNSKLVPAVWSVNGEVVTESEKYQLHAGDYHSLTMPYVTLEDNDSNVKVAFGDISCQAKLSVVGNPIRIKKKMQSQEKRSGETCEFTVTLDQADENLEILWYKGEVDENDPDKNLLTDPVKYKQYLMHATYHLKIIDLTLEDEDHYVFRIRNRGVRQGANLSIQDPPRVPDATLKALRKTPLTFRAGERAKIKIPMLKSNSPVFASWTNGRVTIGDDCDKYVIETGDDYAILEIDNIQPDDAGEYELNLANEFGSIDLKIPVVVIDKPGPPAGDLVISEVGEEHVTFHWSKPLNENIAVDKYIVEVKAADGEWVQIAETANDVCEYTAKGLEQGVPVAFRVKAVNDVGISDPVTSKQVTPAKEEKAPFVEEKVLEDLENTPIIVNAGETATIKIPVESNPQPGCNWFHDDREMLDGEDPRVQKAIGDDGMVELKIENCKRGDSGFYEAEIFNHLGSVKVSAQIKVLDVPDVQHVKINIDDVTPEEVNMSWEAAIPDEDVPVTHYIVERCEEGQDTWEEVGQAEASGQPSFVCKGCKEKTSYKFRVTAVNKVGKAKPVTSPSVKCGAKMEPPTIDPKVLEELTSKPVTVKEGHHLHLKIPFNDCSPPPQIAWEKDEDDLVGDGSRIMTDQNAPLLTVHKCTPSDAGTYMCRIYNPAGEILVPIDVIVFSKPSSPEGPLEVSDISATGCMLNWKPSTFLGGSSIAHYIVERREVSRNLWTSVGKTDGPETSFRVDGITVPGKEHFFRVRAVTAAGMEGDNLISDPVLIKDPYDPPGALEKEINCIETTQNSITIGWEKVEVDGGSPITGYIVERRKYNTAAWKRCNTVENLVTWNADYGLRYTATELREGNEYEFRVIACNIAGLGTPSRPSRPFMARTPVDPPDAPTDLKLTDSQLDSLSFSWQPGKYDGGVRILGYDIELKLEGTDEWVRYNDDYIYPGTSYTVRGLLTGGRYSVRVRTVNDGNYSSWYTHNKSFIVEEMADAPSFTMTPELELAVRKGFTIQAGSTLRLHVPYHARPPPTVTWHRDDLFLDEGVSFEEGLILENKAGLAILIIKHSKGFQSGSYKITLTNKSGSVDLAMKVTVLDVPSPPQGPLTTDVKDGKVILNWQEPLVNTGGDLKGYIVQRRMAQGRDWETVSTGIKNCTYTVDDMEVLRSYYFGVKATNEIGESERLETKHLVYIKQKAQKVQIDSLNLGPMDLTQPPKITVPMKPRVVCDGVKCTLSCTVSGKPRPTIQWFKDDKPISNDQLISIESVAGMCRLVIRSTKGYHSGIYKVVAENPRGKATCEASLRVEE